MNIDVNWIYGVFGLLLGFLFKVLFDELKSPRLKILTVSDKPFPISPEIKVAKEGFDNYYMAYRIKVENKQKRYLNCAAENCIAWIELESAPEAYQICWVGSRSVITLNVGDIQEVDLCALGNMTGKIYAPTERGYFEPSPRLLGDGKSELKAKLRITSKNGRKEEKPIVIKPSGNQLEITSSDKYSKERHMVNPSTNSSNIPNTEEAIERLSRQIESSEKAGWFRFLLGLGFAIIAVGMGVLFSANQFTSYFSNTILVILIFAVGFATMFRAVINYRPQGVHRHLADIGVFILLLGAILMFCYDFLSGLNLNISSWLIRIGIPLSFIGFMLMIISLKFGKSRS